MSRRKVFAALLNLLLLGDPLSAQTKEAGISTAPQLNEGGFAQQKKAMDSVLLKDWVPDSSLVAISAFLV